MLILLPAFGFVMLFLSIFSPSRHGWCASLLFAAVIWGCLVVAITEGLSLFDSLTRDGVALAWGGVLILATNAAWRRRRVWMVRPVQRNWTMGEWWRAQSLMVRVWMGGILLLLLATGIAALLKTTINYDSMTYHLSRCMYWIEQQSVAHYPTHNLRQLYLSPWLEFATTHTILLSGGDRYVVLLSWLSLVGSLVAVVLIVDHWTSAYADQNDTSLSVRSRWLAILFAVTVLSSVVQATSTQNNLTTGFWVLCSIYGMQRAQRESRLRWDDACLIGASAGLAILTKGTAYVHLAPFAIGFALIWLRRARFRSLVIPAAIMIGLVLVLNAGHWLRNWALFDDPLGPTAADSPAHNMEMYHTTVWGPAPLASNLIRNAALHATTPVSQLNTRVFKIVEWIHKWVLGFDLNDPRTTFLMTSFTVPKWSAHEDMLGSPLHVLILGWVFVWIVLNLRRAKLPLGLIAYAAGLLISILLFCALFKWQPWHTRLHVPFFLVGAPLAGYALAHVRARRWVNVTSIVLLLMAGMMCASPYKIILDHRAEPHAMRYFAVQRNFAPSYRQATTMIAGEGCTQIGLYQSEDMWDYPLWGLLDEAGLKDVAIRHVNVSNISGTIHTDPFVPCAVIVGNLPLPDELHVAGTSYTLAGTWDYLSVWLPTPE